MPLLSLFLMLSTWLLLREMNSKSLQHTTLENCFKKGRFLMQEDEDDDFSDIDDNASAIAGF